jgi:gluconolactonase
MAAAPVPAHRVVARGLDFPEGPIAMPDGSVLVVEIDAGRLTRVGADGAKTVVAEVGGGPNGAAIGPDGACYLCNNGGLGARSVSEAANGSIQRVDLKTGAVSTVLKRVGDNPLIRPNDLVFDSSGGFWFTDSGRSHKRTHDFGGIYWAKADGSQAREVIYPSIAANGLALSPDGRTLYVIGMPGQRQISAYTVSAPGELEQETAWTEFGWRRTGSRPRSRLLVGLGGDVGLDSMKVEANGNLVVGVINTGALLVLSPEGREVERIPFPDPLTTNISFGGSDRKTLFVCQSSRGELWAMPWPRPGLKPAFV